MDDWRLSPIFIRWRIWLRKHGEIFIKIGEIYGENIDIKDLLPNATSISRKVHKDADEKRPLISREIKQILNCGGTSATIDMWTDNYVKRNFLGVTLQYQKDFKFKDVILGLKSMGFQQSTRMIN